MTRNVFAIALALASSCAAFASDWSAPVDVQHEFKPCVTYRARLDGDILLIQATVHPGWHTFTMDNDKRSMEKLAGKPSLGVDQPTKVKFDKGLELAGGWMQSQPKDFSKPELRWYSWGYEDQAYFAAKVRRSGGDTAQIGIRGQTCTETTCKNVDVSLTVPLAGAGKDAPAVDLKSLIPVQ